MSSVRYFGDHIRFLVSRDKEVLDLDGSRDMTGSLTIDGSADEIQLKVQGYSTQTSNLLTLEKSDGTDVFTVTNAGAVAVASTLAVTGAATLSSTLAVTGAATLSSSLAVTGAATLSSTLAVTGVATASNLLASGAVAGVADRLALGYDTLRTAGDASDTVALKANGSVTVATYMKVYHNNVAYYVPLLQSDPQTV